MKIQSQNPMQAVKMFNSTSRLSSNHMNGSRQNSYIVYYTEGCNAKAQRWREYYTERLKGREKERKNKSLKQDKKNK